MAEILMHVQEDDDGTIHVSWWEGIEKVTYRLPEGMTVYDFVKATRNFDFVSNVTIEKAGRA